MKDKQMDIIDKGKRSEIMDKERKLVEKNTGPLNKERWAGKEKDNNKDENN